MIAHHLPLAGIRMPLIELPRALEDYFAFAETTPTRNGRRFTISLPYFDGTRLDRLQWWYHVTPAQEQMSGDAGMAALRLQATERFCRHIERWLENTGQRLHGDDPIPRIGPCEMQAQAAASAAPPAQPSHQIAPVPEATASSLHVWPKDKVANG